MHPVELQVLLNLLQLPGFALHHEVLQALLGVGVQPLLPVLLGDINGDLLHVVGMVAVVGQGVLLAEVLEIPGDQRLAQHDNLVAGVVDIELPQHVIAALFQQAADGVAPGRAPGVAAVQIPGGVGGHPLHQDVHALAGVVLAEAVPGVQHLVDQGGQRAAFQLEVDEAGPGHGDGLRLRQKLLELFSQGLGDVHGALVQGLGQLHGRPGGVVPQLGVPGHLHRQHIVLRLQPVDLLNGLLHGLENFLFKIVHDAMSSLTAGSASPPAAPGGGQAAPPPRRYPSLPIKWCRSRQGCPPAPAAPTCPHRTPPR